VHSRAIPPDLEDGTSEPHGVDLAKEESQNLVRADPGC
jgi:hypothetical protein